MLTHTSYSKDQIAGETVHVGIWGSCPFHGSFMTASSGPAKAERSVSSVSSPTDKRGLNKVHDETASERDSGQNRHARSMLL